MANYYSDALEAVVMCELFGGDPVEEFGEEIVNFVSSYSYQLKQDTPAKRWWNADPKHPATARALRIDPAEHGAFYALYPFRLVQIEGQHLIAAAWPAPCTLTEPNADWLDIEAVILWDPVSNTARVEGDEQPDLVGSFHGEDEGTVYGDPREFFRAWAEARAIYFAQWAGSLNKTWSHPTPERDLVPGMLATGPVDAIRWSRRMPPTLRCVGLDPRAVNRAILKSAHLPRAVSGQMRLVA